MCPPLIIQFPDSRVGLIPVLLDDLRSDTRRRPTVGIEHVPARCRRKQEQGLAESVQLELIPDVVAPDVNPARVTEQIQRLFPWNRPTSNQVRRFELVSVG